MGRRARQLHNDSLEGWKGPDPQFKIIDCPKSTVPDPDAHVGDNKLNQPPMFW